MKNHSLFNLTKDYFWVIGLGSIIYGIILKFNNANILIAIGIIFAIIGGIMKSKTIPS